MNNDIEDWMKEFNELNPIVEEVDTALTKTKLDFGTVMRKLDTGNKGYYGTLTDKEKKDVSPWVYMRSMSSAASNVEHYLLMTNDLVNVNFNCLTKHPELQWKLLCLCALGQTRHIWIPPPKKTKKNRLEEKLLEIKPLLKDDELEMLQLMNTKDDFKQYFIECGLTDEEIKQVLG